MLNVKTLSPRPWIMTRGGIEVQIERTTAHLNAIGVNASYFNFYGQDDFDILHLFSSDYTFNDLSKLAKGFEKKLVVSSIYYSEYPLLLKIWMNTLNNLMWRSYFTYKKNVLSNADLILPNSYSELCQIRDIFDIPERKLKVVPNGVDEIFEDCDGSLFVNKYGWSDFVLCVSRLDSRKNIHNLIHAILKTDLRLVIIGSVDHTKDSYGRMILDLIKKYPDKILYLGSVDHSDPMLRSAYGASSIHALTSKLETPGLCNLEAGLAGKKIVVSDLLPIREYLSDYAFYCDPYDVRSIKSALLNAYSSSSNDLLRNHIKSNFLWSVVAQKTKEAYLSIL